MKISMVIVKELRNLDVADEHARGARALFVAQAFAFKVPFNANETVDDALTRIAPMFDTALNEINEFMPVDVRLAQGYLRKLVETRCELIAGVKDTALLRACLDSDTAENRMPHDSGIILKQLVGNSLFGNSQVAISNAMQEYFSGIDS